MVSSAGIVISVCLIALPHILSAMDGPLPRATVMSELDLAVPEDEVVEGYSGYSSRWFAVDQPWPSDWWWKVLVLRLATPERPDLIGFFPIENQRWLLSYIGVNKSYPPRSLLPVGCGYHE